MNKSDDNWHRTLAEALSAGECIGKTIEQFNNACEHITQLLQDASDLLELGSHATSAFLSITAIEETAKVHTGMYRRSTNKLKRSRDHLYKHGSKHALSLSPTVAMGERLKSAIGDTQMHDLIELGRQGGFVSLREASLYIEQKDDDLLVPKNVVPIAMSRKLLLLAIEAFDDSLVGYSDKTFKLAEQTDALFQKWASA